MLRFSFQCCQRGHRVGIRDNVVFSIKDIEHFIFDLLVVNITYSWVYFFGSFGVRLFMREAYLIRS